MIDNWSRPKIGKYLIMHFFLQVLLLLPLDDRGRPDGGEVLRVDGGVVAHARRRQHLALIDLQVTFFVVLS